MASGNYYLDEKIGDSGIAKTQNPSLISDSTMPFKYSPSPINTGFIGEATSKYDEYIGDVWDAVENGESLNDLRYEAQSGWDILGNSLANFSVIAGTTVLSGTLGLAEGIIRAAAEGDISKIWDNNTNNWVTDIQEATREAMPIYRGQEYENMSTLQKMGTGVFWGDLGSNMGYAAGMLIPGMGVSKLVSAAPKLVRAVIPSLASAMSEASIEAVNTKNEEIEYKTQVARDTYSKLAQQQGVDLNKLNQEYQQTLNDINEDATKAGNYVLGANMALLTASNALQFGKLFSGGFNTASRINNYRPKLSSGLKKTSEGLYEAGKVGVETAKSVGKKLLLDAPMEGFEEVAQGIISEAPSLASDYNRFNESKFNPEKADLSNSIIKALGVSFSNALNDKATGEEFMMGYLTSVLGIPTFSRKTGIALSGNILTETKEARQKALKAQRVASDINARIQNMPEMKAYYNGLIRHASLQEDMNSFLDSDNPFDYKTAESAQFISDIMMFDEAGDIERLREIINTPIDTSKEGVKAIIEETSIDGEGPFMVNGNPMSSEDVAYKIEERQKQLNSILDTYLQDKEVLSRNKVPLSRETMESALFLRSQQRNFNDRLHSLIENSYTDVERLYTEYLEKNPKEEVPTLNKSNFLADVLFNQEFLDFVSTRLNDSSSSIPYNERKDITQNIQDIPKLLKAVSDYGQKLQEVLTNPIKEESKIEKNKQKAEIKKQNKKDFDLQNTIDSKSVSEINRGLDEGELDLSELESITEELESTNPEELSSVQKKTKEALDIREKQKDIERAIDASNADEQTKEDAKKLLNNSRQQAESLEELLDLDSEAFLDNAILIDENSVEEFSTEELEEVLTFRADQARELLHNSIVEEDNIARELANMPIEVALAEVAVETTGKDQVSTVDPINKKDDVKDFLYEEFKEELDSENGDSLRTLLQQVQTMAEQDFSSNEILKQIETSPIYNRLSSGIQDKLNSYINSSLYNTNVKIPTENKIVEEENNDDTIDISDESLLNNQKHKEDDTSTLRIGGILQAWLSPYTQYYRYSQKGNRKPFINYAKESGKYTEAELKRIGAIYKYFTTHNVFSNINNGAIKVGDKVTFFTDETLNNDAGDFVILMKSNGIVIGALPPIKLASDYIGLPDFITEFKEAYEASNKGLEFTYGESEVMQNMVGKVPYEDLKTVPLNTLNTIYQGNNFTLGISRSDGKNAKISIKAGRTRSFIPKASDPESRILSPLDAKKGQPYLMIESSDPKRQYVPIPFIMSKYSIENNNSLLGQAINNVLEKLKTAKSSDTLKIKQELQELLSISEVYLEIKDGNVLMRIKPIGASKFTTILNSPQSEENIVEYAKKGLYGQPFQVSVKYINSTYKGQSYNNMIGEIAKTNLPIGEYHTIDDWFTIRPVGKKGVPIKTIRNNPNKAKPTLHEVTIGKDNYKVNLNTFDVYKLIDTGVYQLVSGYAADVAKAIAYGYKTSATEDVYKTEWGLFDSKSEKFIEDKPKEDIQPIENIAQELNDSLSTVQSNQPSLTEQAKNVKLITTEKKKRVWEALEDKYKQKLLDYTGLKQKQMMEGLERAYRAKTNDFDLSKLKGSLDSYFEVPLFRKEESSEEIVSVDKELKWLNAVLPQLAAEDKLRLVEGLIKISKEDGGGFAWGQFKQGIITLPKVTAKGTVYHEAFHAVVHTLLTDSEVNKLFEAAKDKYGDLDTISLEENLAEDFRRYIQLNELDYNKTKLQRFIDNIFRTIKNIINKIRGKESYIDNLFYRINSGNYSSRIAKETTEKRNMEVTKERLQSIVDTVVNKTVHTVKGRNNAWRFFKEKWAHDGYLIKGYKNEKNEYIVASFTRNGNTEKNYYRKVEQHYRDKYNLNNLSNEDLQYLHDRNLPLSEYSRMSSFEKEVLFHCK